MIPMHGSNDEKLDALFRAFAACPVPEPSANFMPMLWQKIESRQTFTFSFRRMANAFAAAAVALTVAFERLYVCSPRPCRAQPELRGCSRRSQSDRVA